jgi:hypothetical protein
MSKALLGQLTHELGEALTFVMPKKVGGRHADIVEEQFGRVVALDADLVEVAPPLEAVHFVGLDNHEGNSATAGSGIRLGDHEDEIGLLPVGDEGLRTVDDVVVAVPARRGPDALQVRSGSWLGHRDGAYEFSRRKARQPAALLLLGAVVQDIGGHDSVVQRQTESIRTGMTERFRDRRVVSIAAPRPAVGLRDLGTEEPCRARLVPQRAVDHFLSLEPIVMGYDLGLAEALRRLAHQGDIVGPPGRSRNIDHGVGAGRHVDS